MNNKKNKKFCEEINEQQKIKSLDIRWGNNNKIIIIYKSDLWITRNKKFRKEMRQQQEKNKLKVLKEKKWTTTKKKQKVWWRDKGTTRNKKVEEKMTEWGVKKFREQICK